MSWSIGKRARQIIRIAQWSVSVDEVYDILAIAGLSQQMRTIYTVT